MSPALAEFVWLRSRSTASAWSGNLDFMDEHAAALVPGKLINVVDPQRLYKQKGMHWFEPDPDPAIAALRRLADDPRACAALGAAGRAKARSLLSGGAAARLLRNP